ncbi:type II secretion system protein [Mucisphaera calidilacus]|uniref:Prepilin-type N-terminal cleavage/methylation domain-containing protein n=1 Tax=Mucisphaera calidilacus TaxID=2527982 RepID=A0A518BU69_9BACT|nr:prepilin-type N-terminal cleavage/methylation domain-containing protein [Mucisphaera calidilacus]QDU70532.1 hypothetical protein Pan265_03600 [Mucisphaera calidilacus]
MNEHGRQQAFTLIELLVVISILALLIGLLLPALGKARARAQDLQCVTGIRSLGQSLMVYTMDYDGYFGRYDHLLNGNWNNEPVGGSRRNPGALPIENSVLIPYLGIDREQAYVCPVFERWVMDEYDDMIPDEGVSYTYTYNAVICWLTAIESSGQPRYKPYDNRPVKVDMVANASAMAMFVEENPWGHPRYGPTPMNDGRFVPDRWPNQDTLATFHQADMPSRYSSGPYPYKYDASDEGGVLNTGISNVVFVDGHVSQHKTTESEYVVYGGNKKYANVPEYWPN